MRSTRCIASILWTLAIGAMVLATATSPAVAAKADQELLKAADKRPHMVNIIVQTPGRPTFEDRALVGAFGGEAGLPFSSINAFPARVPSPALKGLANNPRFSNLSIDAPLRPFWDRNAVRPPVGVPEAYATYGVTGAGVGVAIVDSGAANHEDFSNGVNSSIRAFVDIVGETNRSLTDPYGHGTHVAGILSGHGNAESRFAGVAPGASLYILRVLDGQGRGTVSRVLMALDWISRHAAVYNIRVVNLSLGHPVFESYTTDPLCLAVKALAEQGLVVVAAAGNFGRCEGYPECYGGITVPGNSPYAITVGAMNAKGTPSRVDDVHAAYSSRGPTLIDKNIKPDLSAQGTLSMSPTSVGSYLETNYSQFLVSSTDYGASNGSGDYFLLSGTSMAAPVVSGIAALMLQKNPSLTPTLVKGILMYTAEDRGYDVMTQGAGLVNAVGAVEAAYKINPNTSLFGPGEYWLTEPLSGYSTIDGQYIVWSGPLVTDKAVLWTRPESPPLIAQNFEELWGQGVYWEFQSLSFTFDFEELGIESSAVYWDYLVAPAAVLWQTVEAAGDGDTVIYGEGTTWSGPPKKK